MNDADTRDVVQLVGPGGAGVFGDHEEVRLCDHGVVRTDAFGIVHAGVGCTVTAGSNCTVVGGDHCVVRAGAHATLALGEASCALIGPGSRFRAGLGSVVTVAMPLVNGCDGFVILIVDGTALTATDTYEISESGVVTTAAKPS